MRLGHLYSKVYFILLYAISQLTLSRMPPGKNMDDILTILRSGLWRLYYKLSREGKRRFYSEFLPLLHKTKHEVMGDRDDQSYYLVYLGTKPSARGKGYARKLIEHGLKMVRTISSPRIHDKLEKD
jgi:ribosomal protein S18 acetylase RimI-like enzyme